MQAVDTEDADDEFAQTHPFSIVLQHAKIPTFRMRIFFDSMKTRDNVMLVVYKQIEVVENNFGTIEMGAK